MRIQYWLSALALMGCAGFDRGCSSTVAQSFGADWVVVKTDINGKPFRCWKLEDTSISNESQSDGIYWKTPTGHLVHISGFYDRVQVTKSDWAGAYSEVGITAEQCKALGQPGGSL